MKLRGTLLAAVVIATLGACADDGVDRAVVTVHIERSRFDPPEVTVPPGTTIRFVNDDPSAHTVTASDGASPHFDSGELETGQAFEVTLHGAGTHRYTCTLHPTMRGAVVVG